MTKLSKLSNNKGFTLVELLIVIAIIAILAAVALPVYTAQLDNAREAVDEGVVRSAASLAQSDYLLNNTTQADQEYFILVSVAGDTNNVAVDAVGPHDWTPQSKLYQDDLAAGLIKVIIGNGGVVVQAGKL